MRILVVGAGATGGYFGGRLLQAGRDVVFLVRPKRAAQLATSGLAVRSSHGDFTIHAPPTVLSEHIHQPFDLILLSCKAYDLAGAMESLAPAVGPETVILPLLNGMRHLEVLDGRFGKASVLGGRCLISVTLNDEGVIVQLTPIHTLSFGEREGGTSERVGRITDALAGTLFEVSPSEQIVQEMWEKWVFLATLAGATCLMRASIGDIVASPGGRDVMLNLLEECRVIADAQGYKPRAPFLEASRTMLTTPDSPITASMLRDIESNARIEADHIIGDLLSRRPRGDGDRVIVSLLEIAHTHLQAYQMRRSKAPSAG